MKHTAIFYTNNNISLKAFQKVLSCFIKAINHPSLPFDTLGVIVSVFPVLDLLETDYKNIKNIIASQEIINKGHLSIIEKISLALALFPSDYVSLHEHDVLYPEEYLLTLQNILEDMSSAFDYLAYNNIIGVNKTGYQQRTIVDHPLSTLAFPYPVIKDVLDHKRREFSLNGNWCYLEPGYGGSYGTHLRRLQLGNGVENLWFILI
ncbi:hypothetical protein GXP67_09105 [Rhodocytophaga rosea]|uniref:Glycosyltransferase family 2 protein n=1 Tax=Rhodocytophaga rosea TaxID=2704465 RepID=A0A6C0GG49_9BACT|nr:hypothetical protein [Rhodocytophaga rosea]QHT66804.1 hypothetical protein GXP67_09105 [Rhodocytophaga rosea]